MSVSGHQRQAIAGAEDQPQARMALETSLAAGPSHAYLFHGPAGVGKRTVARAFAAELLAEGGEDPDGVRRRVQHGVHPDLTWVRPTGAHVMRTEDVDGPVVAAATRTPFESARRVFVLERVETMNDEVANRMLKTLEEPAAFVHLILICDAIGQVLPTVISRCQLVRFGPLPAASIATALEADGVPADRAAACARLAMGNGARARYLASEEGEALRADVDRLLAAALAPGTQEATPAPAWQGLLDRAKHRRGEAEARVAETRDARLESEPKGRDRGALERQFEETAKREGRRAQTEVLDLGLSLAALGFRDLVCIAEGADAAILDPRRATALAATAGARDPRGLREAAERCEHVRLSLSLNVTEDLALEALGYRLLSLVGSS
jgi:DNA polymerase-3 subunit delta'